MAKGDKPTHKVLAIEESGSDKSYWHDVGIGWLNQDGSINLKLHMFPLPKLQVRGKEDKPE